MTNEKQGSSVKGWVVVGIHALLLVTLIWLFFNSALANSWSLIGIVVQSILLIAVSMILPIGYFTLQPNEAKVLVLFGKYKGTVLFPWWKWRWKSWKAKKWSTWTRNARRPWSATCWWYCAPRPKSRP